MKRREAISGISIAAGAGALLPQLMFSGCETKVSKYPLFAFEDTNLLNEIADTILPETSSSPGAKAANVGEFVQAYVSDCYNAIDQKAFLDGWLKFKTKVDEQYGKDFSELDDQSRIEVIREQESLRSQHQKAAQAGDPPHFYHLLKSTVLFGYFTSEQGATQALEYLPVPGGQKGIIPYEGEKAWAL